MFNIAGGPRFPPPESRVPSSRPFEFVPPMALHSDRQVAKTSKSPWTSRQSIAAAIGAALVLLGVAGFLQAWLSRANAATAEGETAPAAEPNRPGTAKAAAPEVTASYELGLLPFLKQYCVDCHGDGAHKGDFSFDRYRDLDALKRDRQVWTKALKLLKIEAMPPADADVPPSEERAQAVQWLDHQLFYVDCSQPQDPGRVTVRRLNKTEYNNTVRDLLGLDFHPADDFPSDDTGHGFDNISDVLTVPPLLLEKYLGAAEDIADRAVRTNSPLYARTRCTLKPKGNVRDLIQGKVLILSGDTAYQTFEFPRGGSYVIRVEAKVDEPAELPAKLEIHLGTKALQTFEIKTVRSLEVFETSVLAKSGPQKVSATLTSKSSGDGAYPEGTSKKATTLPKEAKPKDANGLPTEVTSKKAKNATNDAMSKNARNPRVVTIELEGPFGFTDAERRAEPLVRVLPQPDVTARPTRLASNLRQFLPRAFRREVPG